MGTLIAIIFGLVGCMLGFFIPKVSNQMIEIKLKQRQRRREKNILDQRNWIILIAIANGLLWGIIGYFTTNVFVGGLIGCLVTMAIMFTVIDLMIHIIPNEMIVAGFIIGVVFQISAFGLNRIWIALLCMAAIIVIFTIVGLIFGLDKIGAGDVKLAGLMGLILSYPYIVYAVLAMSIALIVYSIMGMALGKLTHVSMFAFAPFIMIGLITGFVIILFPNLII